jgi:hypothetical protein
MFCTILAGIRSYPHAHSLDFIDDRGCDFPRGGAGGGRRWHLGLSRRLSLVPRGASAVASHRHRHCSRAMLVPTDRRKRTQPANTFRGRHVRRRRLGFCRRRRCQDDDPGRQFAIYSRVLPTAPAVISCRRSLRSCVKPRTAHRLAGQTHSMTTRPAVSGGRLDPVKPRTLSAHSVSEGGGFNMFSGCAGLKQFSACLVDAFRSARDVVELLIAQFGQFVSVVGCVLAHGRSNVAPAVAGLPVIL